MRLFTKFKQQIVMKKFRFIKSCIQESHHSQCAMLGPCPSSITTPRLGKEILQVKPSTHTSASIAQNPGIREEIAGSTTMCVTSATPRDTSLQHVTGRISTP
ncbi:hypothetical protein Hamer_G005430 [Homarus americanus]|uniref:Uncharacterized protein n=1 Tax=Homarus americanus TaxID=6706 RepID=A0A8J5K2L5_HOMAM|nr:hypothetical protein Hamer_G005430 [Homarus americanus]